ncbi:MAG: hypothetical protein IJP49_09995 [Bacteroidales bacterium]|nr:hypothetical protein [Bacteroidales bacterium]
MKKLFFAFLTSLLVGVPALAAEEDYSLYTSSDGKVSFDMFSHIGYGYHFVSSSDFKSNWSGEFFFNILKVEVRPAEVLGLSLGLDARFNNFNSKNTAFALGNGDNLIKAFDFGGLVDGSFDKSRGGFNVFSLDTPFLVKGIFGNFELGVGAFAAFNLAGNTYYSFMQANRRTEVSETKAKLNTFNYGLFATFSYDDIGVYFRYYPKSSRLLPDGSVDLSYMTLGIAIDF